MLPLISYRTLRLRRKGAMAIIPLLCALLAACSSGGGDRPVPRPRAYPRVVQADTAFTAAPQRLPMSMEVPASAPCSLSVRPGGGVWLSVAYPLYGARVDYTFMPVDTTNLEEHIYSRQDRIRQNLGAVRPDFTTFDTPDGYTVQLLYAPSVLPTPVQFLAVNPDEPRWLVSGAAFYTSLPADATLDSLLPMSAVLRDDISRSLHSLREKP